MIKGSLLEVFKVGDRVTSLITDQKGIISRLGRFGKNAWIKWDNAQQDIHPLTEVKKIV